MSITNQNSKNNTQNENKFEEFMDDTYEQINKDISKILSEMEKEKQNQNQIQINNKDNFNFNKKLFDAKNDFEKNQNINKIDNNKIMPNINMNFIDIKAFNQNNNNTLNKNQLMRNISMSNANNNKIPNNNYPVNILINNLPFYNINIINNNPFLNQTISERSLPGQYNIDNPYNIINLDNIIKNIDKRTTLIIRNIPNKYTIPLLLIELNENFKNKFDTIYLPQDKIRDTNLGFGFINFINPFHLILFYEEFMGKKWNFYNSQKRCFLAYSNYQGKNDLINYILKKLGIKDYYQNNILNEKLRKSIYINDIKNIKVPIEIPIKYQIKFLNYNPFSLCYRKDDKVFVVEKFKK